MQRPELNPISIHEAIWSLGGQNERLITMSVEQWDNLLSAAYDDGWTLLELNAEEQPVAAYKKAKAA